MFFDERINFCMCTEFINISSILNCLPLGHPFSPLGVKLNHRFEIQVWCFRLRPRTTRQLFFNYWTPTNQHGRLWNCLPLGHPFSPLGVKLNHRFEIQVWCFRLRLRTTRQLFFNYWTPTNQHGRLWNCLPLGHPFSPLGVKLNHRFEIQVWCFRLRLRTTRQLFFNYWTPTNQHGRLWNCLPLGHPFSPLGVKLNHRFEIQVWCFRLRPRTTRQLFFNYWTPTNQHGRLWNCLPLGHPFSPLGVKLNHRFEIQVWCFRLRLRTTRQLFFNYWTPTNQHGRLWNCLPLGHPFSPLGVKLNHRFEIQVWCFRLRLRTTRQLFFNYWTPTNQHGRFWYSDTEAFWWHNRVNLFSEIMIYFFIFHIFRFAEILGWEPLILLYSPFCDYFMILNICNIIAEGFFFIIIFRIIYLVFRFS